MLMHRKKKKKMKLPFGSSVGRIPGDQMRHNENYTSAQSYIAIYWMPETRWFLKQFNIALKWKVY